MTQAENKIISALRVWWSALPKPCDWRGQCSTPLVSHQLSTRCCSKLPAGYISTDSMFPQPALSSGTFQISLNILRRVADVLNLARG